MESEDTDVAEKDPSGRYIRFHEILGKGPWKTVFKAFDEVDGIEVAWNQTQIKDVVRSQEHLEMLHAEVHLLKSLKHENIIKYYFSWVDETKRTINIITELFTSGSLRNVEEVITKYARLPAQERMKRKLEGLQSRHSRRPS